METITTSASAQLSAVLVHVATAVGSALTSWEMQQALPNCSTDGQKQYYDLVVKQQIQLLMEKENIGASHLNNTPYSNVTPIHLENDYTTSSTPKSDEKDVLLIVILMMITAVKVVKFLGQYHIQSLIWMSNLCYECFGNLCYVLF